MEPFVLDLIEISHYAAQHPRLVQGGGGNCSVKRGNIMAIKSSGIFLEEMSETAGYCFIDLSSGAVSGPSSKPSLEAPLHRLLGRYVIHTHPVALGAFVCSVEGREALAGLFSVRGRVFVPYADPGKALFTAMEKILAEKKLSAEEELVLFLENHGLFVSAPSKERSLELHEETVRKLEAFLGIEKDFSRGRSPVTAAGFLPPDHAVYSHLGPASALSPKQKTAAAELDAFTASVLALISSKRWTPKYLDAATADRLLNMEEEKHRQNVLRRETP